VAIEADGEAHPGRPVDAAVKRLIHLANYPNQHPGSFIPWLLAVLEEARARGWEVEAGFPASASGAWLADFEEREIPVRRLEAGNRRRRAREVRALVEGDERQTLIHTHFTVYDLAAAFAARGHPACHVYWHIHTVLGTSRLSVLRNSLKFRLFSSGVDRIIVPAENIGEGLVERSAPADRIMLLPSAIDPDAYVPPSPEQHEAARRSWEIPEGASVLLHIGRAWELKGGRRFFEAVGILREQGVNVVGMTLRGGEDAERDRDELGLGDGVRIVGRVDDIRSLYAVADCFVAPSRGEGMPYSIVEATASGIPVVASDLPGHRYLGDPLDSCIIVSNEPAEIAGAIRGLLERPEEQVVREGLAARQWIEDNLSLAATAKRLVDSYEESITAPE
jgi:glycosyltransferase involved in cell wall biosynthesis